MVKIILIREICHDHVSGREKLVKMKLSFSVVENLSTENYEAREN